MMPEAQSNNNKMMPKANVHKDVMMPEAHTNDKYCWLITGDSPNFIIQISTMSHVTYHNLNHQS